MRTITASVAVALALVATGAAAAEGSTERAVRGSAGNYGDAGCGLGSLAFGNQQGFVQILAATTNGIVGTQTFGITSGTSNCHGLSGAQTSRLFIEANREALAKEISRGSGEALGTLTWIAGCSDSHLVGAALQRNFKAIFPDEKVSDQAVSASILEMLRTDAGLACQNLVERS
jgi:hypothetical protein